MELFPTYSFSMVFGLICYYSSRRLDYDTDNWVEGRPFTDDDYYKQTVESIQGIHEVVHGPSIASFQH